MKVLSTQFNEISLSHFVCIFYPLRNNQLLQPSTSICCCTTLYLQLAQVVRACSFHIAFVCMHTLGLLKPTYVRALSLLICTHGYVHITNFISGTHVCNNYCTNLWNSTPICWTFLLLLFPRSVLALDLSIFASYFSFGLIRSLGEIPSSPLLRSL
jgi:hypothetical protein